MDKKYKWGIGIALTAVAAAAAYFILRKKPDEKQLKQIQVQPSSNRIKMQEYIVQNFVKTTGKPQNEINAAISRLNYDDMNVIYQTMLHDSRIKGKGTAEIQNSLQIVFKNTGVSNLQQYTNKLQSAYLKLPQS